MIRRWRRSRWSRRGDLDERRGPRGRVERVGIDRSEVRELLPPSRSSAPIPPTFDAGFEGWPCSWLGW